MSHTVMVSAASGIGDLLPLRYFCGLMASKRAGHQPSAINFHLGKTLPSPARGRGHECDTPIVARVYDSHHRGPGLIFHGVLMPAAAFRSFAPTLLLSSSLASRGTRGNPARSARRSR